MVGIVEENQEPKKTTIRVGIQLVLQDDTEENRTKAREDIQQRIEAVLAEHAPDRGLYTMSQMYIAIGVPPGGVGSTGSVSVSSLVTGAGGAGGVIRDAAELAARAAEGEPL